MEAHRHVFDSDISHGHTVVQGVQFLILTCECGAARGYGGVIVRPDEAEFYGHTEAVNA